MCIYVNVRMVGRLPRNCWLTELMAYTNTVAPRKQCLRTPFLENKRQRARIYITHKKKTFVRYEYVRILTVMCIIYMYECICM